MVLRVATKTGSVYLVRTGEVMIVKGQTSKTLGQWIPIADFGIGSGLLIVYKDMKTRRTSEIQSVIAYCGTLPS